MAVTPVASMTVGAVGNLPDTVVSRTISLLHGFDLRYGDASLAVSPSCQRLLGYLALRARPTSRARVVSDLWPDTSASRAGASLRSAIWRTPAPDDRPLIIVTGTHLSLAAEVAVDFHAAVAWASAMLAGRGEPAAARVPERACWGEPKLLLCGDLLPEWDEEWVVLDRERFRQLRLHALELSCDRLSAAGRYGEALEAGLAALEAEPLRESARRAVVRVHIREGNLVEALRAYRDYERLLAAELGLRPSEAMLALVRGCVGEGGHLN